ncbi:hypothetical protein [Bacillus sp. PPSBB_11]|uniref:hypothetical protein n=1 Tax=Bacillus sp. PPSBB_11 TaxID=3125777 RepID=UPI0030FB5CDB
MKPEITKEQAEAIEFLRKNYDDNRILEIYVHESIGHTNQMHCHSCGSLCEFELIELAAALINGYEIEKSPEQKVREHYEKLAAKRRYVPGCIDEIKVYTEMDAIRRTLDMLGIEIDFVNVRREEAEANGFGY